MTATPTDRPLSARGNEPMGFEIAGNDGSFIPALARIEGSEITVWHTGVPAPPQVRHAWANNFRCHIVNERGLPLPPYRQKRERPPSTRLPSAEDRPLIG